MGPDLSYARSRVEGIMDDEECRIVNGVVSTFNTTTGVNVDVDGPVLYAGPCRVRPADTTAQDRSEGDADYAHRVYEAAIPLTAPAVARGAILVLVASQRDPRLTGQRFTVRDSLVRTFAVQRDLYLETNPVKVGFKVLGDTLLRARLVASARVVQETVQATLHTHAYGLQTAIQANASGRPGPRAQTGDYRRSWTTQKVTGGAVVGTDKPQGRRLEYGFVGADSLGRVYAQPPFPHVAPATAARFPLIEAAVERAVKAVL